MTDDEGTTRSPMHLAIPGYRTKALCGAQVRPDGSQARSVEAMLMVAKPGDLARLVAPLCHECVEAVHERLMLRVLPE